MYTMYQGSIRIIMTELLDDFLVRSIIAGLLMVGSSVIMALLLVLMPYRSALLLVLFP